MSERRRRQTFYSINEVQARGGFHVVCTEVDHASLLSPLQNPHHQPRFARAIEFLQCSRDLCVVCFEIQASRRARGAETLCLSSRKTLFRVSQDTCVTSTVQRRGSEAFLPGRDLGDGNACSLERVGGHNYDFIARHLHACSGDGSRAAVGNGSTADRDAHRLRGRLPRVLTGWFSRQKGRQLPRRIVVRHCPGTPSEEE